MKTLKRRAKTIRQDLTRSSRTRRPPISAPSWSRWPRLEIDRGVDRSRPVARPGRPIGPIATATFKGLDIFADKALRALHGAQARAFISEEREAPTP